MSNQESDSLKLRTARTLKWNVIDRVLSQVLYAVTGIVLARELSQTDFGLVGVVLVFQAFAQLLVDSGFSYALIQRKNTTRLDYSSVLWFNILMAIVLYIVLWFMAPAIASWFQDDARIIPLSRVMFTAFILNAASIVQANRFIKNMNVRPVALANALGLSAGSVAGIALAISGYGAWAIVWQTIINAAVRTSMLWIWGHWWPVIRISWQSLRSFMSVGIGMMATSLLNTIFLNIYSFIIGNRSGLAPLGYYTQSNKWSTMGISSLSQVLTSSSLPVLSEAQDDPERFIRVARKFDRMTAYLVFPAMFGLVAVAEPLFHTLFGTKWDPSILLFRILLVRGIFTVLTGLYNNCLIALGRARLIVWMEIFRDGTALVALILTLPFINLATSDNPVYGLSILLWGQLIASVLAWLGTLICASAVTRIPVRAWIADFLPYLGIGSVMAIVAWFVTTLAIPVWCALGASIAVGAAIYLSTNALVGAKIQRDAINYMRGKL